MLTKEQLLAVVEPKIETVDVKGVGKIRIKVMDGAARDELQKTLREKGTSDSVYFAAVIVAAVVDASGAPMFTADEVELLRAKSYDAIRAIGVACSDVNRLGADQQKEAEKNSEAIQNDSSGTV